MINARVNAYELICCLSTVKHYKISPSVDDAFVVSLYAESACVSVFSASLSRTHTYFTSVVNGKHCMAYELLRK